MKLLFGQVPPEHDGCDTFVGKSLSGKTDNFYYMMEVEDESGKGGTFTITDTCGRFMPLDFNNLDELIEVLQTIQAYRNDKLQFIEYWKTQFGLR